MESSNDQRLSRGALIALVVGSMVGSGIFALPAAFGRSTGALGAMISMGHRRHRHADAGVRVSNAVSPTARSR